MPVMMSEDNKELVVTCKCGCGDGIHIKIDDEDKDSDYYGFVTYMNNNWYRDQNDSILRCIGRKLKKIWAIIWNKDYYYSDVLMSCNDFQIFKEYINQFGDKQVFMNKNDKQNYETIKYLLGVIKETVQRIDENCEEKIGTGGYSMYDDILTIANSVSGIFELLKELHQK